MKIKHLMISGLIATSVLTNVALAQKDNSLTKQEKKDGWELLFDGKTTKGWHTFNKGTITPGWTVQNGTLQFDNVNKTKEGGDAVTDQEFGDFHFKLEWKLSKNGNSGIMFLVKEDPKYRYPHNTGPEMQVLDNEGHRDGQIITHRAGDLYDLITSKPENVKPIGEWNSIEIKLQNSKLEFWQNGAKVVETTLWDDNWRAMVANSKFKNLEDFAKFKEGRIALQDHGDLVWFKNIKIKKL